MCLTIRPYAIDSRELMRLSQQSSADAEGRWQNRVDGGRQQKYSYEYKGSDTLLAAGSALGDALLVLLLRI